MEQSYEITESILDTSMQAPAVAMFLQNLDDRILWIDDEIDQRSLDFAKYIIRWNIEDRDVPVEDRLPIRLMIFSPGGDLDVNNALVDIIQTSTTPVYGYNIGTAYSAGAFIFLACHKRYALPNATFLIHKGSTQLLGDAEMVASHMQLWQNQIENLIQLVHNRTTVPISLIRQKIKSEWFITAAEAHDRYGFVDEIITKLDQIV